MSGGVDSAVAAALLHREGYDVVGVTLRLYTEADDTTLRSRRTCCGVEDVADARAAAQRIGIPHYVLNMEREFERDVIDVFTSAYAAGRTPNPCLACNDRIKFSTLLDRANAMGIEQLATGHYARIREHAGRRTLHAAADDAKDQSYVLYTLGQDQLARLHFPLGDLAKPETRRVAAELGLGRGRQARQRRHLLRPRRRLPRAAARARRHLDRRRDRRRGRRGARPPRGHRRVHGRAAARARHRDAGPPLRHVDRRRGGRGHGRERRRPAHEQHRSLGAELGRRAAAARRAAARPARATTASPCRRGSSIAPRTASGWPSNARCGRPRPARPSCSTARPRVTATRWSAGA